VTIVEAPNQFLTLASERVDGLPRLLASLSGPTQTAGLSGSAWLYRVGDGTKIEKLDPPSAPSRSYGQSLAVIGSGPTALLAVGDPESQTVWLFSDDGTSATVSGCIGVPTGEAAPAAFGKTLAAGNVTGGAEPELVVADGKDVHVLRGEALAGGGPSPCRSYKDLLAVTVACRSTADISGCGSSDFGAALAVGDFDRDQDGEVVVGAPGMSVRGESTAGAVFVYDVEGNAEQQTWVLETRFISSAESGDRLGTSVAMIQQPDRDLLLAGAPGNGKAALFLCSKLLPSALKGSRCK
jgi:hypothetical protein